MRHSTLKHISEKRAVQMTEYYDLVNKLRKLCGNRSDCQVLR